MNEYDRMMHQKEELVKRERHKTFASEPNDVWERVFWKWVGKGADRSYAAWMADRAEKRARAREDRKS